MRALGECGTVACRQTEVAACKHVLACWVSRKQSGSRAEGQLLALGAAGDQETAVAPMGCAPSICKKAGVARGVRAPATIVHG